MNSIKNIKSLYAFALALVFMSPLLMNPIHHAFFHHTETHHPESKKPVYSTPEKECAYCDFHFFHFTSETFFYSEIVTIEHIYKSVYSFKECWFNSKVFRHYSGRAPPLRNSIHALH